ncbi:gamma-glutamylcyclotransferase family protein [Vibrio marisflavi]|uniref:Gamma-glutamylcyclotransferase family protein n=1 Tax=Vibrio marisflavi CECT 7928 TaxID=634439 RepID=A0ABM9A9A6_9VIBR|nr:gamma-glutamylcyclotransferase family protein [Vibrio marisflavi]CAH0541608.1 Gamma-glutamylcyclotransferase family protein YtfP [Vibrio marisflavi CECT 7928]
MKHLVFVYGTLRKGEYNHHYISRAEFIGVFTTLANYSMYDLGEYPAILTKGGTAIIGEVYAVSEQELKLLDKLESVPLEYRREKIETPYGEAWLYLYQDEALSEGKIVSGDWCNRYKKSRNQ